MNETKNNIMLAIFDREEKKFLLFLDTKKNSIATNTLPQFFYLKKTKKFRLEKPKYQKQKILKTYI